MPRLNRRKTSRQQDKERRMMSLLDIYRGRRVLVTGHTGFKGSWLGTWLLELGAEVSGLALHPFGQPNLFEALALAGHTTSHFADIRDSAAVQRVLDECRPEIIFHWRPNRLFGARTRNLLKRLRRTYWGPPTSLKPPATRQVFALSCA